jgi:hypothetical protein
MKNTIENLNSKTLVSDKTLKKQDFPQGISCFHVMGLTELILHR